MHTVFVRLANVHECRQRTWSNPVVERRLVQPFKGPASLGRAEPEIPILPRSQPLVVSPDFFPNSATDDRTTINVVGPQQDREVEIPLLDPSRARAELDPVPVDNPDIRLALQHVDRRLGKTGTYPVVRVQRQKVAPPTGLDPPVSRRRQSSMFLFDHLVARPAQNRQHLQGPRLGGAIVDNDELGCYGGRPLDAGDRLDKKLPVVVTGQDHGEIGPRSVVSSSHTRDERTRLPTIAGRKIGHGIQLAQQVDARRRGRGHEARKRVLTTERAEEFPVQHGFEGRVLGVQLQTGLKQCLKAIRIGHRRVHAGKDGAAAMGTNELEQMTVIELPDLVGVLWLVQEDLGAQPLHRIRHIPGVAVEKQILWSRSGGSFDRVLPKVQEERSAGVLPAPEATVVAALYELLGFGGKGPEPAPVQSLRFSPAPVAMSATVSGGSRQHASVETQKASVFDEAGRIGGIGTNRFAHVDAERRHVRGSEGGAGTVHPGHDQRGGHRIGQLGTRCQAGPTIDGAFGWPPLIVAIMWAGIRLGGAGQHSRVAPPIETQYDIIGLRDT